MTLNNLTIINQNITLVYKSLTLQDIDTRKLKTLTRVPPTLIDNPDLIVAIYPKGPLLIQFADNRIRITLQREIQKLDPVGSWQGLHLWKIALECSKLVRKTEMTAFGFNYDLGANVSDNNPYETINKLFLKDASKVNDLLQTDSVLLSPRIKYKKGQQNYDLILEPLDETRITLHLNVHIKQSSLPKQKLFKESFQHEFQYLLNVMHKLFNDGGNRDDS